MSAPERVRPSGSVSKSPFRWRFAMYDYARGNCAWESYLETLLDAVVRLKLDGLAIYFEDLALFLEPAIYQGEIPLSGWKRLDAAASARGLTLLPLLNLYGHNEQTLAHPELSHFRDDRVGTVLNLGSPVVRDGVRRVLDVATTVFSSPWLHVGFDEAFGLGYTEERETGRPVNPAATFARHLNWACAEVMERGRRPMFWADMAGVYFPEIIPDISRDLIAVDWQYRVEPSYPTMKKWRESGFDLWVAPTIGYSESVWPDNERPVPAADKVLRSALDAGAEGVIFTAWEQGPFPFSARLPSLAWQAAMTESEGKNVSLRRVAADWLRPVWPESADAYTDLSLQLGSINRLLPTEIKCGHPALVRQSWYECHPQAREIHARILSLLDGTEEGASAFPDLKLAHRRFALQAALLDPNGIDAIRLAEEARRLSDEIRESWLLERSAEGFLRNGVPYWDQLLSDLTSWPDDRKGSAPQYQPGVLKAATQFHPDQPTLSALTSLKDREGRQSVEEEATTVWVWHESNALHLRFSCRQAAPPRAVEESVDFLLTRDDAVVFCLDFAGTGDGYLWGEANAVGTAFTQWHSSDTVLSQWHPSAGRKAWAVPVPVSEGWGVEWILPFKELGINAPKPGSAMGLTLGRRRAWAGQPASSWGGMGWQDRDHPQCLSRLFFQDLDPVIGKSPFQNCDSRGVFP